MPLHSDRSQVQWNNTFPFANLQPMLRSLANVMRLSGCEVPEWMLQLKAMGYVHVHVFSTANVVIRSCNFPQSEQEETTGKDTHQTPQNHICSLL